MELERILLRLEEDIAFPSPQTELGDDNGSSIDPVPPWPEEDNVPQDLFKQESHAGPSLKRESPTSSSGSKPSRSALDEEEKIPTVSPIDEDLLLGNDIYLESHPDLSPTAAYRALCYDMGTKTRLVPSNTVFQGEFFKTTCEKMRKRNKATLLADITPLLVYRAELLVQVDELPPKLNPKHLREGFGERWTHCIPLIKDCVPQPDYCVGFHFSAFTRNQRRVMSQLLKPSNHAHFLANDCIRFPFLTCSVSDSEEDFEQADRQNTYNASVAVNAFVQFYKLWDQQSELDRRILAFSISHNHETVRLYAHYPRIDGARISFHREKITEYSIPDVSGAERYMVYNFTRNIYKMFVPIHLWRIQRVVDKMPIRVAYDPSVGYINPVAKWFPV